jgi:hypothetical protein
LALESRLRATPAQLLAHWRHGVCAKAGGGNTFCFFNAHIEKATLSRHRLEENCPWRYHGKANTR